MNLKKFALLALFITLVLVLVGCAPKAPEATPTPVPPVVTDAPAVQSEAPAVESEAPVVESETPNEEPAPAAEEVKLTLEELAKFNGKDGARAYIAVDGVVYDVTDSAAWKDGAHNGFEAGKDLTTEIKEKSPHGVSKLDNVVKIGVLVTE